MLLRKSVLETELVHAQLRYDKVFQASQVASLHEERAMKALLQDISFEIGDIREELKQVTKTQNVKV